MLKIYILWVEYKTLICSESCNYSRPIPKCWNTSPSPCPPPPTSKFEIKKKMYAKFESNMSKFPLCYNWLATCVREDSLNLWTFLDLGPGDENSRTPYLCIVSSVLARATDAPQKPITHDWQGYAKTPMWRAVSFFASRPHPHKHLHNKQGGEGGLVALIRGAWLALL